MFEKIRFVVGAWYEDLITKLILGRLSRKTIILKDCLYNYTLHETNSSSILWSLSSVKALDQLYLPMYLYKMSNDVLKLEHDKPLDCLMIHELCMQLPNRVSNLPSNIIKSVFVLARAFVIENNISVNVKDNCWDKMSNAIWLGKYRTWKYIAYYEKIKSKIN